MKISNTKTQLAGAVLATLACTTLMGCNRSSEHVVNERSWPATTNSSARDTTSNTTVAPTVYAATETSTAATDTSVRAPSSRSLRSRHLAKKHFKKQVAVYSAPALSTDDDYVYDSNMPASDARKDVTKEVRQTDETVSASTMAPAPWRETGLSPYAQEPASQLPTQIGTGQMTGQDRSLTIFDAPGLFQDPAARERDLVR